MTLLELHLIINQNAGSGIAAKAAEDVLSALDQKAIPYYKYVTEYQGHAIAITEKLKENILKEWTETEFTKPFPLLVVLGGDGTLHEVINALDNHFNIPVGYIPCGSGNDFARGIKLSRNPLEALDHLLATTQPASFNIIHYDEQISDEQGYFANNIGIGVDAAIVASANESKTKRTLNKIKMGSMTYLSAALKVVFQQKGFPTLIEINGQQIEFTNTFLCTTTNHPYFGGGIAIAPDASPMENDMELIIIERIHMVKIFHLISLLLRKKHFSSKYVYHYKCNNLRIVSTTPTYGQSDGEVMGHRPFDITFKPAERLFWV